MLETLPAGADLFFCLLAWKQFPGSWNKTLVRFVWSARSIKQVREISKIYKNTPTF